MSSLKDELVRLLVANRAELLDALVDVTDEEIATVPVIGEWTIKDAVGHIAYWEGVTLDHVRETFTRGRPRPLAGDERTRIVNPLEAAKRKGRPWTRVRAEFENVRAALIASVGRLSEIDLVFQVPVPWGNDQRFYSIAQMIQEDVIAHCHSHVDDTERWQQQRAAAQTRSGLP